MNSVPNSDSEQCTESRLGQVHSVHPPMAQVARWAGRIVAPVAVSWLTRRRVIGVHQPCRSACPAVSRAVPRAVLLRAHVRCCAPCHSLLGRIAGLLGRVVALPSRIVGPCRGLSHDTPNSQAALLSQYAHLYRNTIPSGQASLLSRYKTLYRDTHPQRPGPRARVARLAHRPAVSQRCAQPCRRPCPTVSWACHCAPLRCLPALCHLPVTIQYTVS